MSRRRKEPHHPGAVFLVDKPTGPTSHDIVRDVRRWTGLRRVGHGGTLDPLASGLLPIFVGAATRLNEYLAPYRKSYEATVLLGQSTDTDDSEGQVISTADVPALSAQEIDDALDRFRGEIEQVPPQFSAVKRDGVAAYRSARAGEHVEIEARAVTIHELEVTEVDLPHVRLAMSVSTGTYVRAIARDLGEALGCGAHVIEMRRTKIGDRSAGDGHSPDALAAAAETGDIWALSVSPAELFPGLASLPPARRAVAADQARTEDSARPGRRLGPRAGAQRRQRSGRRTAARRTQRRHLATRESARGGLGARPVGRHREEQRQAIGLSDQRVG